MRTPTFGLRSRGAVLVALVTVAACGSGDADRQSTTASTRPASVHLGFLSASSSEDFIAALKAGLEEHGYREGQNLELDVRTTESEDQLSTIAVALVSDGVDLLIAGGTKAVEAAKSASSTIPIVMTNSGDPVGSGLVASMAKPGGNVTGLTQISPDLSAKRLELLKETLPAIRRVGILWNPGHSAASAAFRELETAAPTLGLEVTSLEVKDPAAVAASFSAATAAHVEALVVVRDPLTVAQAQVIVDASSAAELPALYETRNFVDAGGLMLFGPSFTDLYRRSADYVDRILDGAEPADLPIERPTTFEIVVNKRAADAVGVTIPSSVLVRADDVIE